MNWLKKVFCQHEYELETLHGYRVVDGWLVPIMQLRCKKCGKIKKVTRDGKVD